MCRVMDDGRYISVREKESFPSGGLILEIQGIWDGLFSWCNVWV